MMITVDYCRLPGPDTRTKREAATTGDNRLLHMLRIASDIGWPLAWTDDLYRHDREKLAAHPGESFLWILRDTGTHAYPLRCGNRHEARGYCQTIHYWSGEHRLNVTDDADQRARYYVVSSSGVKSLSWQEATKCFSYPER
jgi:hypothetical protein